MEESAKKKKKKVKEEDSEMTTMRQLTGRRYHNEEYDQIVSTWNQHPLEHNYALSLIGLIRLLCDIMRIRPGTETYVFKPSYRV